MKEILNGNNAEFMRNFAMLEDQFDEAHEAKEKTEIAKKEESWTERAARYVGIVVKAKQNRKDATKAGIKVVEALKNRMRESTAGRKAVQKVIQKGALQLANMMQMAENVQAAANSIPYANFGVANEGVRKSARKIAEVTGKSFKHLTESGRWKKALDGKFGIKDLNALPIVGGLSAVQKNKEAAKTLAKVSAAGGAILMYGPEIYSVVTSIYGAYTGVHSKSTAIVQVSEAAGRVVGVAAGGAGGVMVGREVGKMFGIESVGGIVGGLMGSVIGSMGAEYIFGNIAKQLLNVAPDKALKNAYSYLGVQPGVNSRALNKAYHALALTHHPDKPEGSDAKWETLNTHIEVIKVARECGQDSSSGNDEL